MTQPTGVIPTIDVREAAARRDSQPTGGPAPLIVDVRERDEFIAVRAPDVALVPMSTFAERHAELPKDRPLLMVCHSGSRSAAATAFLLRSGWPDVVNVAGGMAAWEAAGLPVRHGEPAADEGDL